MYTLSEARSEKNGRKDASSAGMGASAHRRKTRTTAANQSLLAYLGSEPPAQPRPVQPVRWEDITTDLAFAWLWRARTLIFLCVLGGGLLGIAYGMFATPKYTISSQILIDPADLRVMADDVFSQSNQLDTQLYDVESRLHILTSANVLNSVVSALGLDKDPEFGGRAPGDLQAKQLEALRALEQHVKAQREEGSFIVRLDVWSVSASKALNIANAITASFQDELVKAQADGARRAAADLFSRLDTLKQEVAKADEAVEHFKRDHNILSSSGELVSTIVVNQTNTQLVDAQARVIRARSRYAELSSGNFATRLDSASIESQTMTALRTQYALARREIDAQSAIFGSRHPRIVAMRPQLQALQNQIAAEQSRMLEAAKSELAQAEASLMAQQSQANAMKTVAFEENGALVQLRQLEREAESKSSVYEAFMGRAKQIAERQQINTTNVRVISPPAMPKARSFPPRTVYLLIAGLIVGLGIGCAAATALGIRRLFREQSNAPYAVAQ